MEVGEQNYNMSIEMVEGKEGGGKKEESNANKEHNFNGLDLVLFNEVLKEVHPIK